MKSWRSPGIWLTLAAVLLVGFWPIITRNDSDREVIFTILLSIALASSLNIILGFTGYVSFGHIVFFGLGGYIGLFLLSEAKISLYLAIPAGGAAAALMAFLLGKAILRLRGAYFALATIGVLEATRALVANLKILGGGVGISLNFGIYKEYGGAGSALWLVYYLLLGFVILSIVLAYTIAHSKFGLALFSIREDEDAAEVVGVVTPNAKTWAYVLSAVIPGMVGVLFYFKNGNIEPGDAFRLHFSIELLVMVMLGGFGTVAGPIIGAAGYQRLRGLLLTTPVLKNFQLVLAGVLLLLIILFIPNGFVGWLHKKFPVMRRLLP